MKEGFKEMDADLSPMGLVNERLLQIETDYLQESSAFLRFKVNSITI